MLIMCLVMATEVYAQELSPSTRAAYDAFVHMVSAISGGSTSKLREAVKEMRNCPLKDFSTLIPLQDDLSLDGHLVFTESFALAVIEGKDCYRMAQKYHEESNTRTISSEAVVFYKTCLAPAHGSVKYMFFAKGSQDIAVVAEPGGLLSMRIHDLTHEKWYNDTEDVRKGRPERTMVLPIPDNEDCRLEIEIINTCNKDKSFVILCN